MLGGREIQPGTNPVVKIGQSLTLTGKTIPGGTVIVTIHSDPITQNIVADGAGVWSFDVGSVKTLTPGNHQIELSALDTQSGTELARQAVLSFTLVAATTTHPSKTSSILSGDAHPLPVAKSSPLAILVIAVFSVLTIAAGAYYALRHHKKKRAFSPQPGENVDDTVKN